MAWIDDIEALLRSQPERWDLWRVYGDYLLEHGDVRGEIIGMKHRADALILQPSERQELAQRAKTLQAEHQASWLPPGFVPEGAVLVWRFGFVVGAVLRASPKLPGAIKALRAQGACRFLSRIDLGSNELGDEALSEIAAGGGLDKVVSLDLRRNRIGSKGLAGLLRADLSSLVSLNVSENLLGNPGAEGISAAPGLSNLKQLYIAGNRLGDDGSIKLAGSSTLVQLSQLYCGDNPIGSKGALSLAGSEALRSLALLNLWPTDLDDRTKDAIHRAAIARGRRVVT